MTKIGVSIKIFNFITPALHKPRLLVQGRGQIYLDLTIIIQVHVFQLFNHVYSFFEICFGIYIYVLMFFLNIEFSRLKDLHIWEWL